MEKYKKLLKEALEALQSTRAIIEETREEAQSDFDEKSDKWKESDAGQLYEERLNAVSEALNSLEDAEVNLNEAITP